MPPRNGAGNPSVKRAVIDPHAPVGLNLYATPGANGSTAPVFYAQTATVQALRGVGYNYLGFRLTDDSTAGL